MSNEFGNEFDFDNPLGGLDISLLGSTKSNEEAAITDGPFEIRDEEKDDDEIVTGKDKEEESADDTKQDSDDFTEPDTSRIKAITFKDEDEEEDNEEENESEESSDPNFVLNSFKEAELIDLEDSDDLEEEKSLEWLLSKVESRKKRELEEEITSYKDSLPEEIKFLIEHYEEGVSLKDLALAEKNIAKYSDITEDSISENESLQKELLKDLFLMQGESREDINEIIKDYEDSGLLEKNSMRALKKLVSYEKNKAKELIEVQKRQGQERKSKYENWVKSLKSTIDSTEEIIPGMKLNDKQKKLLFEGITKVDREGKNQIMKFREKDPIKYDLMISYITTVLNGDFSKLVANATTKATKDLKEKSKSDTKSSRAANRKSSNVDYNIIKNAIKF